MPTPTGVYAASPRGPYLQSNYPISPHQQASWPSTAGGAVSVPMAPSQQPFLEESLNAVPSNLILNDKNLEAPIYGPIPPSSSVATPASGSASSSPHIGSIEHQFVPTVYYPMVQISPSSIDMHQYYNIQNVDIDHQAHLVVPCSSIEACSPGNMCLEEGIYSESEEDCGCNDGRRPFQDLENQYGEPDGESPHALIPAVMDGYDNGTKRSSSPGKAIFASCLRQEGYNFSSDDEHTQRYRITSKKSLKLKLKDEGEEGANVNHNRKKFNREAFENSKSRSKSMDSTCEQKGSQHHGTHGPSSGEKTILALDDEFKELLFSSICSKKDPQSTDPSDTSDSNGQTEEMASLLTLEEIAKIFCRFHALDEVNISDSYLASVKEFSSLLATYKLVPESWIHPDEVIEGESDKNQNDAITSKRGNRYTISRNSSLNGSQEIDFQSLQITQRLVRLNARQRRTLRRAQQRAEKALLACTNRQNESQELKSILVCLSHEEAQQREGVMVERAAPRRSQSPSKGPRRNALRNNQSHCRASDNYGRRVHSPVKERYNVSHRSDSAFTNGNWDGQGLHVAPYAPLVNAHQQPEQLAIQYASQGSPFKAIPVGPNGPFVNGFPMITVPSRPSAPMPLHAMPPVSSSQNPTVQYSGLEPRIESKVNYHPSGHLHSNLGSGHAINGNSLPIQYMNHQQVESNMVYHEGQVYHNCNRGVIQGVNVGSGDRAPKQLRRKLSRFAPQNGSVGAAIG